MFVFFADWQIYSILGLMLLVSAIAFYIFYVMSDSFWQVPTAHQPSTAHIDSFLGDSLSSEDPFGPLDL